MERSGHLSREGIQVYERKSEQQEKAMSDLLSNPKATYAESLKTTDVEDMQPPERVPLREIQPDVADQQQAKVKEMFALSGCNVTFNMHF